MLKNNWERFVVAFLVALVATGTLAPAVPVSAMVSYQFLPDSSYVQDDIKATLKIYGFSGPPYPAKVDWIDPEGDTVSACTVGGCGVIYDQHVWDNGVLDWRSFYFYIYGQNRAAGTYTAVVSAYLGSGMYSEMFRASFAISGSTPPVVPRLCYVNAAATGANNGTSWTNAYTNLQSALGASTCTEVWVKSGVYKPTTDTSRSATFQLKNGVALYGGFAGTESSRDQRDPKNNVTILSGDVDSNDSQTPVITDLHTVTGNTGNSYHVVTGFNGAMLDGFTVTAGYANSGTYSENAGGGGMINKYSNPAVANVIFSGNYAKQGGGMINLYSSPTLTNVAFNNNFAWYGGGMMSRNDSSPVITNATFKGNWVIDEAAASVGSAGGSGGGLYTWSGSPVLTNITFSSNTAELGYGGGIYNAQSQMTLTNATFSGNTVLFDGGGLYNDTTGTGSPVIYNTIFWNNTASSGAEIYDLSSTPSVNYSVVQGGYAGGSHILTNDPKLGALGDNGGFTQTFALLEGSSALNTGNDAVCPATDQRGAPRPQPAGGICDIGAFEFGDSVPPTVDTFTAPSSSFSLNIPITTFTASDDEGVTGYLITQSSTKPSTGAAGWVASAPSTYTVSGNGTYTLYPWAKDGAGNVSAVFGSPASVTVVQRTPSTNANLANLVLSTGALTPAFSSGTLTYVQLVRNTVASLTVTPTAADTTATIKVNGVAVASGGTSLPISLKVGSNTITTVVTAENGTTIRTYTVTVYRAYQTMLPLIQK